MDQLEYSEEKELVIRPLYTICPSALANEDEWFEEVDIKLFASLNIISIIFLTLLFVFLFMTQREKLFGLVLYGTWFFQ